MSRHQRPVDSQLALLRAVKDGQVVYRTHRPGYRRIVRIDGNENGQHVTMTVRRLQERGWVREADEPGDGAPFVLTFAGQAWVDVTNHNYNFEIAAAAPCLKPADDGRDELPAGDAGDAPTGAIIELDDEPGGGYWQRQGERWIPVDRADALAALGIEVE